MALLLSLACQTTDHTRALIDGRVGVAKCGIRHVVGNVEEIFPSACRHAEFKIADRSLSADLVMTDRGGSPYAGIPAFPSRAFGHSAIYRRVDRGIAYPGDLKRRRIGVPDLHHARDRRPGPSSGRHAAGHRHPRCPAGVGADG